MIIKLAKRQTTDRQTRSITISYEPSRLILNRQTALEENRQKALEVGDLRYLTYCQTAVKVGDTLRIAKRQSD